MYALSTSFGAGRLFCAANVLGVRSEARRHQRGPALYAGQQPVLWRALILDRHFLVAPGDKPRSIFVSAALSLACARAVHHERG